MITLAWFRDRCLNRVRQFGIRASLAQVVRAVVRPVYRVNCDLVLAIADHRPDSRAEEPEIREMTIDEVTSRIHDLALGRMND